ncbi:MAG: VWA domain-containing protein [Candidatus Acidiferrales bacterium]
MKTWVRMSLLGILIAGLGVPPGAVTSYAWQQEGPTKPAPAEQPGAAPKQPTGQQQPAQAGQVQAQAPQVAISVQSNLVNIDAVVTDHDGNIVTGLQKQNFRVLDNDQPQQISNFSPSDAPITIVVLMEFSARMGSYFGYRGKMWAYNFLDHLNAKDWVAVKTFDLKTTLVSDFTQDKRAVAQDIASLYFPDFSEANLFDATLETLDQLRDVKGRRSILIIASGYDTFSKHTLDQTFKPLKETDVTIFCIGMGAALDAMGIHERNLVGPEFATVNYLQAENQLKTFAEMTGGWSWFPRFEGEMNDIFNSVATFLRNQYTIGFTPSTPPDGRVHRLKVEAVDNDGNPMTTEDKKGHKKKVVVTAREWYTSPKATTTN